MKEIQEAMRERYAHLHSLVFQRSVDKAKTHGELFDILETIPDEYPIVWDEEARRWVHTKDLLQAKTVKEAE